MSFFHSNEEINGNDGNGKFYRRSEIEIMLGILIPCHDNYKKQIELRNSIKIHPRTFQKHTGILESYGLLEIKENDRGEKLYKTTEKGYRFIELFTSEKITGPMIHEK